jgi:hypothetical protein
MASTTWRGTGSKGVAESALCEAHHGSQANEKKPLESRANAVQESIGKTDPNPVCCSYASRDRYRCVKLLKSHTATLAEVGRWHLLAKANQSLLGRKVPLETELQSSAASLQDRLTELENSLGKQGIHSKFLRNAENRGARTS